MRGIKAVSGLRSPFLDCTCGCLNGLLERGFQRSANSNVSCHGVVSFIQSPNSDEPKPKRLTAKTAKRAKISKRFSLRSSHAWRFKNSWTKNVATATQEFHS